VKRLARWVVAALCAGATAAAAQPPILGQAYFSTDADDFSMQRLGAGAAFRYASAFDYTGVVALYTRYDQGDWSASGARVSLVHRDQVAATGEGLVAEIGAATVPGHTRAVGEVTYNRLLGPSTGIELLAASDWVDTQPAIEAGLSTTFVGASVSQEFGPRFTAIALVGRQHFTDGNDRNHLRARLVVGLVPEQGITLQLRYRGYKSDDITVPPLYFNPENYQETQVALAMRRRIATPAGGWVLAGYAGGGQELIDRSTRNPTALVELRGEGPLAGDVRLRLFASYQRASGYESGPNYWFSQLGVFVVVPLH
jgi:hypothetical protein